MSIKHDFHLHSAFSGDSDTPSDQMIEHAVRLGLHGMCFTEHQDIDAPYTGIDFTVDFARYFSVLTELQEKYADRIRINIGIELGFQPHLIDILNDFPKQYPFDFVIASCHFVSGMDPYFPAYFEDKTEQEAYELYFTEQLATLKELTNFDTLGHMDYVVRYGPNQNKLYSYKKYAEYIDPMLQFLIENGKCLELNTGGYKYGLGEPNPCIDIFKRYRELGGELVTIGSDAHKPEHLCYDFDKAESVLKELGYQYYTVFEQRKPKQILL